VTCSTVLVVSFTICDQKIRLRFASNFVFLPICLLVVHVVTRHNSHTDRWDSVIVFNHPVATGCQFSGHIHPSVAALLNHQQTQKIEGYLFPSSIPSPLPSPRCLFYAVLAVSNSRVDNGPYLLFILESFYSTKQEMYYVAQWRQNKTGFLVPSLRTVTSERCVIGIGQGCSGLRPISP
jgi:hypothetical protein